MMADHHIALSLYEICIDNRQKKKKVFVNFERIEAEIDKVRKLFEAVNNQQDKK